MKTALIAASVLLVATACAGPYRAAPEPSSADRQARSEQAAGVGAEHEADAAALERERRQHEASTQPLNMEIFQPPQTF